MYEMKSGRRKAESGREKGERRGESGEGDSDGLAELWFGRGSIDFSRVHSGDKVWKTSDPELERRWRQSFEGESPRFQRPLAIEVHGAPALPLTVIARDEAGHLVRLDSAMPLTLAEILSERLDRLPGARRIVQTAACIGRAFTPAFLAALLDIAAALMALLVLKPMRISEIEKSHALMRPKFAK